MVRKRLVVFGQRCGQWIVKEGLVRSLLMGDLEANRADWLTGRLAG